MNFFMFSINLLVAIRGFYRIVYFFTAILILDLYNYNSSLKFRKRLIFRTLLPKEYLGVKV